MKCPMCDSKDVVVDRKTGTAYCNACGYWWHIAYLAFKDNNRD